jgi:beta-galactosidase
MDPYFIHLRSFFFILVLPLLFSCNKISSVDDAVPDNRMTLSLNGMWEIEDCISDTVIPRIFNHTVPVPGLVNLASPSFENAGRFISRDVANHPLYKNPDLPLEAKTAPVGISLQERNYFWYRKSFTAPEKSKVAILKINKSQFGTDVWINGQKAGHHDGCFTAGYFNLTEVIEWGAENILSVRIGAHPAVLPLTVPAGSDLEKLEWMPGIYDDVTISFSENPVIETVQVAPRINSSEIAVQTVIRNYGDSTCTFQLRQFVKTWKDGKESGQAHSEKMILAAGEQKMLTQMVAIHNPRLWTTDDPFLYVVESNTGGDQVTTRFGMREFRFDRATGWAYLNNKPCFLRGANITLHRFFEDKDCGSLPWQEEWVRKLLTDIPKEMHWNSFRFCIGPVPDQWLDIADEAGLLIANQFFMWVPNPDWGHQEWDLIPHLQDWVRDNRNHPSVVIWDACNETHYPGLSEEVVPVVRPLDLSNRPWQLSNNPPVDPDDPVERHLYVLPDNAPDKKEFDWTYFENPPHDPRRYPDNPGMVNEYGEFWLNRDGTPTTLTDHRFNNFLAGPDATADERFEAAAYYLAGETEYHRAYRIWSGIQHFTYLTCSFPGAYTSDNFRDVVNLELDPYFKDYVGEAFKPLGVNLSFWQPVLKARSRKSFKVMMVNDCDEAVNGKLVLSIGDEAVRELARTKTPFALPAFGMASYLIELTVPDVQGECLLRAAAYNSGNKNSTVSRRKVRIE